MPQESLHDAEPAAASTDVAGVFDFLIDPRGAAKRLPRKYFWVVPLAIMSIAMVVLGIINMPLAHQALVNQPVPANVTPDQMQQRINVGTMVQKIFVYLSPVVLFIMTAFSAAVVLMCGLVIGLKPRFLEMFNLMAGLSIIEVLKLIATTVVIHMKGEPSSMADLQPALGLDIFAPAGMNKVLVAFLGYFNVFQIWEMVMAILIFALAYRVSKGKAAVAVLPVFLIGLVLRLIGAFFTPST
jgi:hypothetical protein